MRRYGDPKLAPRKTGDLACCSPGCQRISREATATVGNFRLERVAES